MAHRILLQKQMYLELRWHLRKWEQEGLKLVEIRQSSFLIPVYVGYKFVVHIADHRVIINTNNWTR
jgi:hypothetical protein